VPDRVDHISVLGVPAGRGAVQLTDRVRLGSLELEAEQVGEQAMVAEPPAARVQRVRYDDDRGLTAKARGSYLA
jgi:hypothetical protein